MGTKSGIAAELASLIEAPSKNVENQLEVMELLRQVLQRLDAIEKKLPRDLVTITEMARRTGLSERTISRKIKAGLLPIVSVCDRPLVDMTAIKTIDFDEIHRDIRKLRESRVP